jgi:hypothetical protein
MAVLVLAAARARTPCHARLVRASMLMQPVIARGPGTRMSPNLASDIRTGPEHACVPNLFMARTRLFVRDPTHGGTICAYGMSMSSAREGEVESKEQDLIFATYSCTLCSHK